MFNVDVVGVVSIQRERVRSCMWNLVIKNCVIKYKADVTPILVLVFLRNGAAVEYFDAVQNFECILWLSKNLKIRLTYVTLFILNVTVIIMINHH